jgi:hypothetical protein
MNTLQLEGTSSTPKVQLDSDLGKLNFEGVCYPENAFIFFEPILAWIEAFIRESRKPLLVDFKLDYFNTSSSKCLLDLMEILQRYHKEGGKVRIIWRYCEDDEDIHESGREFAEDLELDFEFSPY